MSTPLTTETADPDRSAALAVDVARSAGVEIRLLEELADLVAVSQLLDTIWGPSGGTQMPLENLRALAHAGNYVAGAYVGDELVAASVAFFGAPAAASLHSHITGVTARARGRKTGYALKLHQRAWALRAGIKRVTWTFDPVVRRNAHFNLVKLGAVPVDYLVDFYGQTADAINAGQGSDRLFAAWELTSVRVISALDDPATAAYQPPPRQSACVAIRARGHTPEVAPERTIKRASHVVVETPPDIEALRRTEPAAALAWRQATRAVLRELVRSEATFLGFSRAGAYHFERTEQ